MGKRRSITGARKRPIKTATLGTSAMGSVAVDSSLLAPTVSANNPKPRQPISTRNPPSDNPPSWKREVDGVVKQRPGSKGISSFRSRVKHVSQEVIRSKWAVLDGNARAKSEELLRSIELPVLAHHSSEQRKIEAQVALRSITETLCKRLARMPFPPKAKEIHFDYETLAKDNRKMQQSLVTSITSIASLLDEVKKQKLALSSEWQELEDLG